MYARGLMVFALCTALVIGVGLVLNYEATTVGYQIQALPASPTSCTLSQTTCPQFSIVSAELVTMNTTDQLGVATPDYLTLKLDVQGSTPLSSIRLFVGNASAGRVPGPFAPGLDSIANITLQSTASVTPGNTYHVTVEGFGSDGSYILESVDLVAQLTAPYLS